MAAKQQATSRRVEILAPNFQIVEVEIHGSAPLMINKFSTKMRKKIEEKQTSADKVARARDPKDYVAEFNSARYIAEDGWDGFYAGALRKAMIEGVRFGQGLKMTQARGLLFVLPEGFDEEDGTPLVRIRGCEAKHDTRPVRLESGVADLRNRPRYDKWHARVRVQFDADLLTETDVLNLLARAGESVGLCEGRPLSKNSSGIGFGTFSVRGVKQKRKGKKTSLRLVSDQPKAKVA